MELQKQPVCILCKAVVDQFRHGPKTANIKSKKRQSPLKEVLIGHHRSKTAKITKGKGWVKRVYRSPMYFNNNGAKREGIGYNMKEIATVINCIHVISFSSLPFLIFAVLER